MKRRLAVVGCSVLFALVAAAYSSSNGSSGSYTPETRNVEMVTTQALIGEFGNIPGLKDEIGAALAPNGPLQEHEVYTYPSSLTVYVGDTVNITIHNAQKDDHIFNLPALGVVGKTIPPDGSITVSFKATKANTFQFFCSVPDHMPWMQGFLTVLPDSDAE